MRNTQRGYTTNSDINETCPDKSTPDPIPQPPSQLYPNHSERAKGECGENRKGTRDTRLDEERTRTAAIVTTDDAT